MTESSFVQKNSELWKRLEVLLRGDAQSFAGIDARMNLYRIVSGHLGYARLHYPGSALCEYLDGLTAQAHTAIYAHTGRTNRRASIPRLLARTLRENARFILLSAVLMLAATAVAFAVSRISPAYTDAFLPAGYSSSAGIGDTEMQSGLWSAPIMSSSIMVNNIRVCILSFGLGVTCGVGTVYVLLVNGMLLGGLAAVYALYGHSVFFWSLILPHGVWELTAIFLAAAAGLRIGYSLIRPGPYRRRDALLTAARGALGMMGLVVIMLVVAGIIEGFFTPLPIAPAAKLVFSALTAVPLLLFALWVGRQPTADGPSPEYTAGPNG